MVTKRIAVLTLFSVPMLAEADVDLGNVQMSGNWFISYQSQHFDGESGKNNTNKFLLKRSYFTLKKDINENYSVRYTQDLTIDGEGDDAGNVETRLKYLYLKAKPHFKSDFFTDTFIEIGMVHTPWLDYEQKVNTYRVQNNMFSERNKLLKSADFGITLAGNIGGKMDKAFLSNTNAGFKGKHASYMLGIYNGGGYSKPENNNNKMFAARVSYRPMPASFPQLHLSGYINFGKGNTSDSPDFNQFISLIGYTGNALTATAQFQTGTGDSAGKYVEADDPSKALDNSGYSLFAEYRFTDTPWALFGRYDKFDVDDTLDYDTKRYIGGVTYRINNFVRVVFATEHSENPHFSKDDYEIYDLNLEVSF